jgi:chromosome segregation ATPase
VILWVLLRQAEEAQAQAKRMETELEESRRLLAEAQAERETLSEMVTGWEEAFAQAQQEIEALKAAAAASREVCVLLSILQLHVLLQKEARCICRQAAVKGCHNPTPFLDTPVLSKAQ